MNRRIRLFYVVGGTDYEFVRKQLIGRKSPAGFAYFFNGVVDRQICTFDALTEFATDEEFSEIRQSTSGRAYALGLVTASLNYFLLALFFAPVLTMVAIIYMALGNLQIRREFPSA